MHDSVLNEWRVAMPLPNISAAQIEWVVTQVAAHIEQQRQTYRGGAVPLDGVNRESMEGT